MHERNIRTWLFNPYYYLGGEQGFLIGVPGLFLASFVGMLSGSHFDGVLDFHLLPMTPPFWLYFLEGVIAWLAMGTALLVAGWTVSETRYRVIDVYGYQALARVPAVLVALVPLVPGFKTAALRLMVQPPDISPGGLAVFVPCLLLIIVLTVWMVALMYRGYAMAYNVRGARAGISFAAALVAAEVISKSVLYVVFSRLL